MSQEIKHILEQSTLLTKIELFVRKEMGMMKILLFGSSKLCGRKCSRNHHENDNGKYKTVVKMLLRLENAVRDDIFDYIVNK